MRLIAAVLFTTLAAGTATAGPRVIPGWSVADLENGVVCTVKRVTVLAQDRADCRKLGGKVAQVKWMKSASAQ